MGLQANRQPISIHPPRQRPRTNSGKVQAMFTGKCIGQIARRPVLIRLLTGAICRGSVMSFHRTILVAFTAVFATALTSAAFAGCGGCGFGYAAPVVYAPAPVYTQGCGGCGVAVTYAQPVIYMQSG